MLAKPPASRHARGVVRAGFTLVELLVACALTVLVMAILASAFQKGMESLSHLKSAVGLSEQLRSAEGVIRRDLQYVRLETRAGGPVRVSDPRHAVAGWVSPDRGFFRIKHGSAVATNAVAAPALATDPTDARYGYVEENPTGEDNVLSYRATDHELAMTVKLPGGSASNVFVADANGILPANTALGDQNLADYVPVGSGQFAGQWAEVQYFLAPVVGLTTASEDSAAPAVQLYTLRRRFRVLAPTTPVSVPVGTSATAVEQMARDFPELSISPVRSGTSPNFMATINTPATVTDATNRMWDFRDYRAPGTLTPIPDPADDRTSLFSTSVRALPATDAIGGSDVLVSNVVSFQVQPLTSIDATQFVRDLPGATYSPGAALDTAAAPTAGPKPVMRAVLIKLRVYDIKNKMTRQMTIVADL